MQQLDGNIFDGLVTNERTYTELFRNMCRYQFFRNEFARFVASCSNQEPALADSALSNFSFNYSQVETQYYSLNSGTYPDVKIETEALQLVIEIKTNRWTGFQPSQPKQYLDDLMKSGVAHKGLVVLIPKGHSHTGAMKEEIANHRKTSGNRPFILLACWEDFIQRLEDAGGPELTPVFRDYVDLSNEWFAHGRIVLTRNQLAMLRKPMGDVWFKLRALVEAIHTRFYHSGTIGLAKIKMNRYGYGFSIHGDNKKIGWLGVGNHGWIHGPSPILFGVDPDYLENVNTGRLVRFGDEDGLHNWGLSRDLLSSPALVDEVAELVAATFNVEQSHPGEKDDQVQFDEAALDMLFPTNDGPSSFQDLINAVDQIKIAIEGADKNVAVAMEATQSEYSLYCFSNGEGVARVGIFFEDWKEKGLPLWVGVPVSKKDKLAEPAGNREVAKDGYLRTDNGGANAWEFRAVLLDSLSEGEDLVELMLRILGSLGLETDVDER